VGRAAARRVLEAAGHVEGIISRSRKASHGDEGRLTPDVIVKLPGGKNVVVDAKVALTAFLDAHRMRRRALRDGSCRTTRAR
jgi:DNA recombination protein RmuC